MAELEEGGKAPDFTAKSDTGREIRLSGLKGRKIVLYFYPKDDTPGCTAEACAFRDSTRPLASRGVIVVGVSPDSVESHKKFRKKYGLNFSLLSDAGGGVCEKYGVWKTKKFMGREFATAERTTFVISEDGVIEKILRNVDPSDHPKEVLKHIEMGQAI